MKTLLHLTLAVTLLATTYGCDSESPTTDALTPTRLLGEWQLTSRTLNGSNVMDMTPQQGTLILSPDQAPFDLVGDFTRNESATHLIGTFSVDTAASTLTFMYDSDTLITTYSRPNDNGLTLHYTHDGERYNELWQLQ